MEQYKNLLADIMINGVEKSSGRENMPNTIGISHGVIQMDMADGFPLLTTKKMFVRGVIEELLWFLRGETNIKTLVDKNIRIWDGDAYRWYLKMYHDRAYGEEMTEHEFIELIRNPHCNGKPILPYWTRTNGEVYTLGDLGKVYGYQWRNQNGVDQIAEVIKSLQTNPLSRYHIIDGWNKADFSEMALPPCHLLYQFICRPMTNTQRINWWKNQGHIIVTSSDLEAPEMTKALNANPDMPKYYLDLNMYQRSCDTFLGVPFNLASMSLLLHIMSNVCNMVPGVATWIGGDTHIYKDHIPMVKEQFSRDCLPLCNLKITKDLKTLTDVEALTIDDFVITNYQSHPAIKAELFTGNKK